MNFKVISLDFDAESEVGGVKACEMIEGLVVGDTRITFRLSREGAKKINAILQDELDAVQAEISE